MDEDRDLGLDPEALVQQLGLRPICGGSDAEGGSSEGEPAGGDAGGAAPVEGDEGAEGQGTEGQGEGAGDDGAGPGEGEGEPGGEGAPGDGEGADEGEGGAGEPAPSGRANARIRELVELNNRLQRTVEHLAGRAAPREGAGAAPAFEIPEALKEVDGALGGYMRHYLNPIAQVALQLRAAQADFTDRAEFYADNPQFGDREHRTLIERARAGLSQRLGQPVGREDVLTFLKGHTEYRKLFVTAADRKAALDQGHVAARRQAGRVGGTALARPSRGQAPDLSKMSRAERVKHLDAVYGNEPI